MYYKYVDPIENGYKRINISRNNHNAVFTNRKRTLWGDLVNTTEYYEDARSIKIQRVPSLFGKALICVLSPFLILYYGIGNAETYSDIKRVLFAKKYGAFTSEVICNAQTIKKLKGI